jgi:hypothetical protein
MNLLEFNYPKPDDIDMAYSTYNTIPELLEEAKTRKFLDGRTAYNKLFSDLFFLGGKVIFKKNIDELKRNEIWSYCLAFMRSWAPKHEHKEAICAMLMSEILEDHLDTNTDK